MWNTCQSFSVASMIPPCESELVMHLKRVSFVAKMWAHTDQIDILQHPIESDGWDLEEGEYKPIWHQGQQLPDSLLPEDHEMSASEDEENEDILELSSEDESDFSISENE